LIGKKIFFFSPISKVENEPFIAGLERTMMATMLPNNPKRDTAVRRTPSVIKPKVVVRSAADLPNPVGIRN